MPYTIQGNLVDLGAEPFLHNDKHYVPLRDVLSALGGNVSFDNNAKSATATIGQWSATIQMGNRDITVAGANGSTTPVTLTADPYVEDGQMYVPFDFFRDAFGYQVSFAGDTMNITNPNSA